MIDDIPIILSDIGNFKPPYWVEVSSYDAWDNGVLSWVRLVKK